MPLSMYKVSVPIFVQNLTSLSNVLDKGKAHAEANKIDLSFLANMRLYPDMFSLIRQVQQATSHAVRISAALAGVAPPELKNTETAYDDLKPRIARTIEFLKSLKPEQFEGSDDREITMGERKLPGRVFLLTHVFPHFYFHCTTAYDILRHCGVPLAKSDFLGTRANI
ncbi:MAG TPA: DUF1993 domain-containing protein [Alphaproteobacteria bacterium]|nr:DUF1993 domain-containing protein [Alphaproteobacteria bacterium]